MIQNVKIKEAAEQIRREFVSGDEFLELVMITVLAGGHLLLEDNPGVGKTTLANALAKTMGCGFGRVQFTPDTMPSDVTGISIYDAEHKAFRYLPGPVMNEVLLADEINRTSPKTQSSLLEAMEEGQVTVDGVVHPLPKPFFVIATQNPIEFAGTYPLPEAQLDRFMMRLSIGYPDSAQARHLVEMVLRGEKGQTSEAVLNADTLLELQEQVKQVKVSSALTAYLIHIIEATRQSDTFELGASPRAMLALLRAAQASAFLEGRSYCIPEDLQRLVVPVLAHRLVPAAGLRIRYESIERLLQEMMHKIPVPVTYRPE